MLPVLAAPLRTHTPREQSARLVALHHGTCSSSHATPHSSLTLRNFPSRRAPRVPLALYCLPLSPASSSQSSGLAAGSWGADRRAEGLPRAMPEVVDSCSLASPASVCRTKHLHLRCSVDFPRRVLTGTAALTVQSQEDNLRSLVRWDARPVPASPRPPASCPSSRRRPLPGPRSGLPRASLVLLRSPQLLFRTSLQLSLASQPPLPRPALSLWRPSAPRLCPHPSVARYLCLSGSACTLSPTPLPRPSAHPSAASTSCSHPERGLHCSTNPPSPAIRVPSAKPPVASPFPRPAAHNSLLGPRVYSSPRAPSQATVSSKSRTLCPADAHRTLSYTCTSAA